MSKRSNWKEHLRAQGDEHMAFRWMAALTFAGAAGSAVVTASLDAANIGNRLVGDDATQRPWWLHTYSVAIITCTVAAVALRARSLSGSTMLRVAYAVTAALNITVPLIGRSHGELRLLIPGIHIVLAGLLVGMAIVARPDRSSTD